MSAVKNILFGLLSAAITAAMSIVLPIWLFTTLKTVDLGPLGTGFGPTDMELFQFWIISMGSINVASTFFSASAPQHSARKAAFELVNVVIGVIYFYIYQVAGATEFNLSLDLGAFVAGLSINLSQIVYAAMGVNMLNIIIGLYDLLIAIISPIKVKPKGGSF
jgi:hypothetical protein